MKFQTTKERRANLVKLARFLFTEPIEASKFNMRSFGGYGNASPRINCETAGCAIGWGPTAGIEPAEGESWAMYGDRCFTNAFIGRGCDYSDEFMWCFYDDWKDSDNSPQGAAKRILWMLLNGTPPRDEILEMQYGGLPLIYDDFEPTEADWQLAAQEPTNA